MIGKLTTDKKGSLIVKYNNLSFDILPWDYNTASIIRLENSYGVNPAEWSINIEFDLILNKAANIKINNQTVYTYINSKSKLNGQQYIYHTVDARVYLTPYQGNTKTQIKMPFLTFHKAVKDGYYIKS